LLEVVEAVDPLAGLAIHVDDHVAAAVARRAGGGLLALDPVLPDVTEEVVLGRAPDGDHAPVPRVVEVAPAVEAEAIPAGGEEQPLRSVPEPAVRDVEGRARLGVVNP
jgi:hypothetical protein